MPEKENISTRLKHAWNAFFNKDPTDNYYDYGIGSYYRPDRPMLRLSSERTVVTAIYNRISMDVAAIDIVHARLDENNRYLETINSGLENCLSVEANLDQTGRAFIQDVVMSMLEDGVVAIVPTDTRVNPVKTGSFDILSMRTGRIVEWFPQHVKVSVYNEKTGKREDITLHKRTISIVENPLYSVMNESNSMMQRLIRKLSLLDCIDEQNASGKLNIIIQLPYTIKTKSRETQAENRLASIEHQLKDSPYGIAYIDGTEKVTQLGSGVENNLPSQIEYLTKMVYGQLGMTEEILNGSAGEQVMLNYFNRTVEPIVSAIADEMKRKFLTKTARSQHQSIEYFRDPFRLVPVSNIAEIADKFTRNEIMTSNEIRQVVGMKPSSDPKADELRNSNLYQEDRNQNGVPDQEEVNPSISNNVDTSGTEDVLMQLIEEQSDSGSEDGYLNALENLDAIDDDLDKLEDSLKHYASPYYDPVKAHEYYMDHRKLVGRKSTTELNEKGKNAASYVKKNIEEERDRNIERERLGVENRIKQRQISRDSAIARSKANMERALVSLQNRKVSEITQSDANTKLLLSALLNRKNRMISTSKDSTDREIKNIKEGNKKLNEAESEKQSRIIEEKRNKKTEEIERHSSTTKSKIDSLRERLKGMSKEEKAKYSESISKEIDDLRNKNAAKRNELNEAFGNESNAVREETKKIKSK